MNETVARLPKKGAKNFATISNEVLQDRNLSLRARGLLAYVLSKPTTWTHSADRLTSDAEGLHAVRSAFHELEKHGYAELRKLRDPSGKVRNQWVFRESPSIDFPHSVGPSPSTGLPTPVEPGPGEPDAGGPDAGKPALLEKTVLEKTVLEKTEKKKTERRESPAAPSFLSDLEWAESLQAQHPSVNIEKELRSYNAYCKRHEKDLTREGFEKTWLPKVGTKIKQLPGSLDENGWPIRNLQMPRELTKRGLA